MLPHCAYHSLDFLIHIVLRVSMLLYLDLDHLFSQLCSSIYSVILQVTYLFLNWCMFKIFLFFFFSYKHFSKGHFYTCILVSFRINISWIWIININNCWVIDICIHLRFPRYCQITYQIAFNNLYFHNWHTIAPNSCQELKLFDI